MSWTRANNVTVCACQAIAVTIALSLSCASEAAFAQTQSGDAAMAETLFNEGKRGMSAGDYAIACPKLAESYRLDPGGGTLTALAVCHENLGKTASAWTEFLQVVSEARQAGRADREKFAQQHIRALEPRLSKLSVVVAAAIASMPGLEVRRDGTILGQAGWGTAAPVDPGGHTIEATAIGKKPWSSEVTIGPAGDAVIVTVPALQDAPAEVSLPHEESKVRSDEQAPIAIAPTAPARHDQPLPSRGTGQRTVGLVIGAAGLVAGGMGAYFGAQAISKSHRARELCPRSNDCTNPTALTINRDAKSFALAADIAFGLWLAALATGAVVYLTAPSGQSRSMSSAAVRIGPVVSTSGAALMMDGTW